MDRDFFVQTKRGKLMGKVGDYILKGHGDCDVEYPELLSIVDATIFRKTSKRVRPMEGRVRLWNSTLGITSVSK